MDHVPHGICRLDLDGGYVITECSHGKANGHYTVFYSNGAIGMECDYIDGEQHGHETWFNEDGSIRSEADYIHGVRQ